MKYTVFSFHCGMFTYTSPEVICQVNIQKGMPPVKLTFKIWPSSGYCCSIDWICLTNVGRRIPSLNSSELSESVSESNEVFLRILMTLSDNVRNKVYIFKKEEKLQYTGIEFFKNKISFKSPTIRFLPIILCHIIQTVSLIWKRSIVSESRVSNHKCGPSTSTNSSISHIRTRKYSNKIRTARLHPLAVASMEEGARVQVNNFEQVFRAGNGVLVGPNVPYPGDEGWDHRGWGPLQWGPMHHG